MSRRACLSALLLVGAAGGQAAAVTTAQVGVAAASGYTDNALSVSSAALTTPNDDVFFRLEPTLRVWNETPRTLQLFGAGVALSRYLSESQANSVAARGELALGYDLARTMYLSTALSGAYEDVAAITPDAVVGAVPAGGARHVTLAARSSLSRDFSGTWRGLARLDVSGNVPVGESATTARSLSTSLGLSAQASRKRDALEATLAGGVNAYEGGRRDLTMSAIAGWLHELSPLWGLVTGAGATLSVPDQGGAVVEPVARLRLEHARLERSISFELSNAVRANTLLGETFAVSEGVVAIHGRLGPFDLSADGGGSHATALGDVRAGAEETVNTVRYGVSLGWAARENLHLFLRQDFTYQVTQRSMMDSSESLLRNSVMLGVTTSFPDARPRSEPEGIRLRVRQSEERDRDETQQR